MSESSELETFFKLGIFSKLAIINVVVKIVASLLAQYSIWYNDLSYYSYSILSHRYLSYLDCSIISSFEFPQFK